MTRCGRVHEDTRRSTCCKSSAVLPNPLKESAARLALAKEAGNLRKPALNRQQWMLQLQDSIHASDVTT